MTILDVSEYCVLMKNLFSVFENVMFKRHYLHMACFEEYITNDKCYRTRNL